MITVQDPRRSPWLVAATLVVLTTACGKGVDVGEDGEGGGSGDPAHTVQGSFSSCENATGATSVGISVSLNGEPHLSTLTGNEGEFAIDGVPSGDHAFLAELDYADDASWSYATQLSVLADLELDAIAVLPPIELGHFFLPPSGPDGAVSELYWDDPECSPPDAIFGLYEGTTADVDESTGTLIASSSHETGARPGHFYRLVVRAGGAIGRSNVVERREEPNCSPTTGTIVAPLDGSSDHPYNAPFVVEYDPYNPGAEALFSLTGPNGPIDGDPSNGFDTTVTFTPAQDLVEGMVYTFSIGWLDCSFDSAELDSVTFTAEPAL